MSNMTQFATTKDKNLDMILSVEKNLQRKLRPVSPSPLFVSRLENRLTNYPRVSVERYPRLHLYLVALVSMLTSLSICWFFWRFMFKRS